LSKKNEKTKRYSLNLKNLEFNKNTITKTVNEVCSFYDILIKTLIRSKK